MLSAGGLCLTAATGMRKILGQEIHKEQNEKIEDIIGKEWEGAEKDMLWFGSRTWGLHPAVLRSYS